MARFTIAALGAPTHVSAAYSAYLTDSAAQDEALIAGSPPGAATAAAYYDRSASLRAPRWSGGGLARLGLKAGDEVNSQDLAVMLAGRLPATGERLLSAVGSYGRIHLAAATATATGPAAAGQDLTVHCSAPISATGPNSPSAAAGMTRRSRRSVEPPARSKPTATAEDSRAPSPPARPHHPSRTGPTPPNEPQCSCSPPLFTTTSRTT